MRIRLPTVCVVLEVILIILFGVLVKYDHETDAKGWHKYIKNHNNKSQVENDFYYRYASTIYLWMFWPSFNSAITAHGDDQHRTAMNTYYSLASCTLATFAMSALVNHEGKLDMVHIQNAALAGGVAMGTAGEMMLTPFGSMIVGFLAGTISTLGYKYLTPILNSKLKVQDTCGIHNLHGMPGILGAIVGAVTAATATADIYGDGTSVGVSVKSIALVIHPPGLLLPVTRGRRRRPRRDDSRQNRGRETSQRLERAFTPQLRNKPDRAELPKETSSIQQEMLPREASHRLVFIKFPFAFLERSIQPAAAHPHSV
ncbi:UNVERIFIED_CONTAM: hypothetical protein FKN15_033670 [Acipenser sinensis]